MTAIFCLCAIGIGVASVGGMQNLPAVVLAVIVGTLLGFVLRLGTSIQKLSQKMLQSMQISLDAERQKLLLTAVVLFCFSSSGMYGAIKTDEPRTLDFSGVRGFLVTNVCIVQRSAA